MTFGALYQPRAAALVVTNVLTQWREIWVPEIMQAAARAQMTPISEDAQTRTVHCGPWRFVGRDAKDKAAAKRIQGVTASALIVDELPNIPRDVYLEARKRLTEVDGIPPLLITTANPGPPGHWAKGEVVDQGEVIEFPPGSNPTVPLSYYRDLKASLHPIEWERVLTCKWLPTSGLIYPDAPQIAHTALKDGGRIVAGIDAGMASPTALALLAEDVEGGWQIIAEDYFVPYESKLTVEEVALRLDDRAIPYLATFVIDPSAAGLRQALRALGRRVQNPRIKDVRRGIGMVRKGIAEGTLTRAAGAVLPNAEREWGSYSWDKKGSRGRQRRAVEARRSLHGCQALRVQPVHQGVSAGDRPAALLIALYSAHGPSRRHPQLPRA